MPTIEHEAVVQVLNNEPHLIAMLLENFGVRLPSGSAAVIADSNLSDRDPERITGDLDMTIHEARMLALVNIASASPERRESYTRIIRAVISEPARAALEELMKTVIKDPFMDGLIEQGRAMGVAQGEVIGEARILLQILAARGIAIPDDVRARIGECTDTDQLEAWAVRAATANALEDVFGQ